MSKSGTYKLIVSDQDLDQTGGYTLALEKLLPFTNAYFIDYESPTVPPTVDAVDYPIDMDFLSFNANAGTSVRIIVRGQNGHVDPNVELWDPNEESILGDHCYSDEYHNTPCTLQLDLTPASTGIYQLAMSDAGYDQSGGYEISLICLLGECPPIVEEGCGDLLPNLGLLTVNDNDTKVCLEAPPTDPVILLGPPSFNGGDPGVAQVDSGTSPVDHLVRFKEWNYKDGTHANEVVSYLVLGEGVHTMPDGSSWQVGSFTLDGTADWLTVFFNQPFSGRPYLFLTMQTENGGQTASVRARDVQAGSFQAALFEQESFMDGHVPEKIGYLAISNPTRGVTPEVKGLGGMATIGGRNVPYYAQRLSIDHNFKDAVGASLKVEEEQSADSEVWHISEDIDVLALGGQVFSQQVSNNGGDTTALRRNARTKE